MSTPREAHPGHLRLGLQRDPAPPHHPPGLGLDAFDDEDPRAPLSRPGVPMSPVLTPAVWRGDEAF